MTSAPTFLQRSGRLTRTCTAALLTALLTTIAPLAAKATERTVWQCAVFYTPARQLWQREVLFEYDAHRLVSLRVDGVAVYTFAVRGTSVLTAIDNERIRIDLDQALWQSDFRGQAQGEGRCARQP